MSKTNVKAKRGGPGALVPLVDPMRSLLALDVSSTACGSAFWEGKADRSPSFGVDWPPARWENTKRIDNIVVAVEALLILYSPDVVVMEWSDGRSHARIGKANYLSVLGAAQGAVRQFIRSAYPSLPLLTVGEQEWTNRRPKEARALLIEREFPTYAAWAANDKPGRDAADALGIGLWCYAHKRVESK